FAGGLGGAVQEGRSEVCNACRGTPRWLSNVQLRPFRLERCENGAETRPRRRVGSGSAQVGTPLRGFLTSRGALVVLRRRHEIRLRRERPQVRRALWPRATKATARGHRGQSARRKIPQRLAGPQLRTRRQLPARSRLVRLVD